MTTSLNDPTSGLNAIPIESDKCGYPAPYVAKVLPKKLQANSLGEIEIEGSFFTPQITLESSAGVTIDSIRFVSDNKITANITTSGIGTKDLTLSNGLQTIVSSALEVVDAPWIDLRENGEILAVGTDLVVGNSIQVIRNASGMYFQGARLWRSSAAFEKYKFVRGDSKSIEIIFNNAGVSYMVGVGKNPRNINSSAQYYEAELVLYFSGNRFNSLFGDRSSFSYQRNLASGGGLKVKFTDDVKVGSEFFLYQLDSTNPIDWDDESNLVVSDSITSQFRLVGEEIFPFIIPVNNPNNYITALRVL